ncbi:MAG TPA: hypothetical protein VHC67_11285 [Gaiellaceae bacterium]|nr:hypothetical protein [Gaiellaceae bacterium]
MSRTLDGGSQSIQLFVYPEELERAEPAALAEQVLGLGCDAVSMALTYHPARRVFPRSGRVSLSPGGAVSFTPARERYGRLVPEPTATPELRGRVEEFRQACRDAGLGFRAWLVALHNEPLARAHPDAAARTLDGAETGFSLCPSSDDARDYVAALVGDVCARFEPDGVDLEAALYPAWEPSYTLTLVLEPLSERALLYGAQCFCAACRPLVGALEERVRGAAGPPFAPAGDDDVGDELAAARAARVESLLRSVQAAAGEVELCVTVSGPAGSARLRGLAPRSAQAADRVLLGLARLSGAEIDERLRDLRPLAGDRPVTISLNWFPERTPDVYADDARRVAAAGADRLALYNLSLVPDAGLDGFAAAAAAFKEAA